MNAPKEQTSFFGLTVAPWTHIHLLSGVKGRISSQSHVSVVMESELGTETRYDKYRLHLTWAPLNNDSQGEQA
ncbi:hypothetical protein [Aeromonas allosaccharophila]|uniref:hypothetical protein n=1 Tax=Aeromonas allosaccharophila TaxID=656 RepID=UPI003AF71E79